MYQEAEYYNKVYKDSPVYNNHYTASPYFNLWLNILPLLKSHKNRYIVDIGCGPGQFGQMLYDNGFKKYIGMDFSKQAIDMARRNSPQKYEVVDISSNFVATRVFRDYNVFVCLEVLEHLEDDIALIKNLPMGSRFIFSLPNYGGDAHVRHFKTTKEITNRYKDILDIRIMRHIDINGNNKIFYGSAIKTTMAWY